MAVIKKLTNFIYVISLLFAQHVEGAITKIKTVFNLYTQDGSQGEQIYDTDQRESVDVFEPMLFIDHQIDETTTINAHFVLDTWTAASDTKLDGNTGASMDDGEPEEAITRQGRGSAQIGISQDFHSWKWSSRLGMSSEYDYKSLNLGGNLEGSFAQDNFSISIAPQIFFDRAKTYDLQANDVTDFKGRTIYSLNIAASQLLTPSDIIQFGVSYIHMHGMLNNISNTVKVNSNPYSNTLSRVEENLPNQRERYAVSSQFVHAFTAETATSIHYRYYNDTWGIKSDTAELSLRQSYFEDDGLLQVNYRYYKQSANKYYAHEFSLPQTYMTSDSDFEAFTGKRYGIAYQHNLGDISIWKQHFENLNMSAGVYYYDRSNDLTYTIVQSSFSVEF